MCTILEMLYLSAAAGFDAVVQMKNFLDKVGPIIVGIRQSVGATVINEDCIQRRWVSAS